MIFSSTIFLFVFLPITIVLYFLVPQKAKNPVLLLASVFFYAWGGAKYLHIMVLIILTDYACGRGLDYYQQDKQRKIIVFLALVVNFLILGYFKYFDFFLVNINAVCKTEFSLFDIALPIGISFFTFQGLSYVIDVYRRDTLPQKNFFKLALYIASFPQLIIGPIIKYRDIYDQLDTREHNIDNIVYGIKRFIFGLGKKVLIANTLGQVADKIFAENVLSIDCRIAWLGAICYSLQLYYDFSGYSDMAIGLGRIFGFKYLENFNYPYISKSITEFWRRWHISLGTWFKEYMYFPLGGNRKTAVRTYINLFLVFLATGIWHGANWTFVVWGLWHGAFIIFERIINFDKSGNNIVTNAFKHLYTILILIVGWVIFRSETIQYALEFIKIMFIGNPDTIPSFGLSYYVYNEIVVVLFIGVIFSMPILKTQLLKIHNDTLPSKIVINLCVLVILILSASSIASSTYSPFIYFKF